MRTAWVLALCLTAGSVRAGGLEIAWDEGLAFDFDKAHYQQLLEQIVSRSLDQAEAGTGLKLEHGLKINVYTRVRYEKEFGSEAAHTQGAHYFRGAIYVNGGSQLDLRFGGAMTHEMSHAMLDAKGNGKNFPTWFNEGLAETLNWSQMGLPDLATPQAQELKTARQNGTLVPLLQRGPMNPFRYLQSHGAVLFLKKKYGPEKLLQLIKATAEGAPFEQSLHQATSSSTPEVEKDFGDWVDHLL